MTQIADVIDSLVGINPGSRLDAIRANRPAARDNAQQSYLALFAPATPGGVTLADRFAVALFVAGLHDDAQLTEFYRDGLDQHAPNLVATVTDEIQRGRTSGPYGRYPAGPLSREDTPGAVYSAANPTALGNKLAAAFAHAHLLVYRPREASAAALQALLDAGWSTTDVVTLSQLVAFLSFQIRVVVGFRALAASLAAARPVAAA
jgi:CMD domain protein